MLSADACIDAHLWYVDLDIDADLDQLVAKLSRDERDRAAGFVFERDRRRFVVARSALRSILAERVGIPAEELAFETLPTHSRNEAFFHAWVRKEAFLKATGEGLSRPLADIEVSFAPRERARVLAVSGDTHASRRWSMIALKPCAGFVGAIVAEAPAIEMAFHRFHRFHRTQATPPSAIRLTTGLPTHVM